MQLKRRFLIQTLVARLRRWQATIAGRLPALPPFWAAFSLTLTETLGAGILALPIVLTGVGPWWAR